VESTVKLRYFPSRQEVAVVDDKGNVVESVRLAKLVALAARHKASAPHNLRNVPGQRIKRWMETMYWEAHALEGSLREDEGMDRLTAKSLVAEFAEGVVAEAQLGGLRTPNGWKNMMQHKDLL
jgi:hypothetical protein